MKQTNFKSIVHCASSIVHSFKSLILLLVLMLGVGNAWGYKISFKDSGSTSDGSTAQTSLQNVISDGSSFLSSISCSKVYNAKSGYGIKMGSGSAIGSVTLTMSANGQIKPTQITVNACYYGTDGGKLNYKINGGAQAQITLTNTLTEYEISMDGATTLNSLYLASSTKRIYIESVTVSAGSTIKHGVNWSVNGSVKTDSVAEGAAITFSTPTSGIPTGKTFTGWTASPISGTQATAPTYVTSATMGQDDVTYYAVFATVSVGTDYTQITAENALEAGGRYLIVGNSSSSYNALPVDKATSLTSVTPSSSKISSPDAELVWTLEGSADAWKIKSVNNNKYLQISGGSLTFENSTSLTFSVSVSSSKFTFTSSASSGNKVLSYYHNGGKFNAYTSANNVYVYKTDVNYSDYCTSAAASHSVTLNTNGGTIADGKNVTSYSEGTAKDLPTASDITKTGNTFQGWFDNSSCEGTAITQIPSTATTDVEYWAKWQVNSYTLTWTINGGTIITEGTAAGSVQYGATLTAPILEKTGHNYSWNPEVPSTMPAEDATYAAVWTAQQYDITYKDQGNAEFSGTGWASTQPTIHTYGTATTLVNPTKVHHTFVGWYTTPACDGTAITQLGATDYTADITLYAKWTAETKYNANFSANGTVTTKQYYAGESIEFPKTATGCDDKVFTGWYNKGYSHATDAPTYVTSATMGAKDTTFYAVFATVEETEEKTNHLLFSYSSHTDWKITKCTDKSSSSYYIINTDGSIVSPNFDVSNITNIDVTVRTFGGASYKNVTINCGTTKVASLDATSTTLTKIGATFESGVSLSGTKALTFTSTSTTQSNGPGISDIDITYKTGGKTYSDYATTCVAKTLESISINTENVKKAYFVGETFSADNLVCTATFNTGNEEVTPDSIKGYNMSTAGQQTVTVYYSKKDVHKTAEYTINVYSVSITKSGDGGQAGNAATFDPATRQITVTNAEHYMFQGFSNVSGVTLTGATSPYTLSDPTANVTMTATWEAAQQVTISFSDKMHSTSVEDLKVYQNETFTFPELADKDVAEGTCKGDHKYFYGWVPADKATTFTEDDILWGESDPVSAAASYVAVWAARGGNTYYLIGDVSELTSGNYIINAAYGSTEYALGNTLTNKKIAGVEVTYDDETGSITTDNSALVWTVSKNNANYSLYNAAIGKYLNIIADGSYGQLALEDAAGYYTATDGSATGDNAKPTILTSTTISGQQIEFFQGNFTSYKNQAEDIYLFKQGLTDFATECVTADVEFTIEDKELVEGDEVADLNAWISNISEDYDGIFTFASDDATIFSVNGVVGEALKQGTCSLTVTAPAKGNWNETVKAIKITVNEPTGTTVAVVANPEAAATSVTATPNNNVKPGNEVTLEYVAATGYTFSSWTSEQVTVSNNKFTMPDPAVEVTVTANFTAIPVDSVTLKESTKIEVGSTETLTATILPSDALVQTLTWASDDENVATVDQTGLVTAKATGTANITATSNNSKVGTCVVTVTPVAKWKKVTASKQDWTGEYLLVYEPSSGDVTVWDGKDATKSCPTASKDASGQISKTDAMVIVQVSTMNTGYSLKIKGGTNDGKYVGRSASSNGMDINTTANQHSIVYDKGFTITASGGCVLRYNTSTDQKRFRYYTSGQSAVTLYERASTDPEITLDPDEYYFGSIKDNETKNQVFTISANSYVTGTLTASLEGTDAGMFNVGSIVDNKVTVTFNPNGTIKDNVSASLKITADNANVTADLTGVSTTHEVPEITLNKEVVDFGSVLQGASVSAQTVTATLAYLSEANVAITTATGSAFTVSPTTLTASGDITITPSTAKAGQFTETLTVSGEGATAKQVTVKMNVVSKWALTYTSNVNVSGATVSIDDVKYNAAKVGSSGSSGTYNIKFPAGTSDVHFHAIGWKDKSVKMEVKNGNNSLGTITLTADNAISGSSTDYALTTDPATFYGHIKLQSALADETTLTFTTASGSGDYRFVLFGVNQEGGPEMTGISIQGTATKLEYFDGEDFDPAGLEVWVNYNTGDPKKLTSGYTFNSDPLTAGQPSVSVTATYNEFTSAPKVVDGLNVKAIVVESLELSGNYQTTFHVGDVFNYDNLVVTAIYNNKVNEDVTNDAVVSTPDLSAAGVKTVTVTYSEVQTSYNINVLSGSVVFYESFDTNDGTGGNDDQWSGNGVAANNIQSDNSGWIFANANGAYKCAKFGSGSKKGSAQTPAISATGDFILTFKAGAWDGNSEATGLTISTTSGTLSETTLTMTKAAWTEYKVVLTGVTADFRITFAAGQASNNRFFLDEVMVKTVTTTRTLKEDEYSTICLEKAVPAGDYVGFNVWDIESATWNDTKLYSITIVEHTGDLVAGMPYIICGTAENQNCYIAETGTAVSAPVEEGNNGLFGKFEKTQLPADDGYYVISNGILYLCGSNSGIYDHRAYIKASEITDQSSQSAPAAVRRVIGGKNTPTMLENIFGNGEDIRKMVIDNQLIIIRGSKMYNAAGAILK